MDTWTIDWGQLFLPSGSIVEVVLRGTVLFLALFVILRLLPRRQIGSLGVSDLLVIVLIADAAQNGLSGEYKSITEGVVLVATILFWNWAIDTLDYRFPALHLNAGTPRLLVSEGRMMRRNMEKEELSEDELMSHLRQQGIEDVQSISKAYVEGDGRISVIKASRSSRAQRRKSGLCSLLKGASDMNWDRIQGNWKQFKGKAKEQWGKLTDDDLDQIAGKREQLAGKIQESYGIGQDEAERQLKDWERRLDRGV